MVLTDPRFRAQLNGGQMTVPEAVEQSLWDEPPFSAVLGYFAMQDTELGGQQIQAGRRAARSASRRATSTPGSAPTSSANMQGNRSHLAFGGGPHECPGQDIGRAIADTGVDALLMRLPDVELAVPEDELRWTNSLISSHLVELPVVFSPRQPVALSSVPARPPPAPTGRSPRPSRGTAAAGTATPRATHVPPPARRGPAAPPVPRSAGGWRRLLEWVRGG